MADDLVDIALLSRLFIESVGAMLGDHSGRNIDGQKILKLDVARAIEHPRHRKIPGKDSPQADGDHDRLCAQPARGKPSDENRGCGCNRVRNIRHETGSAFLSASSIVWRLWAAVGSR